MKQNSDNIRHDKRVLVSDLPTFCVLVNFVAFDISPMYVDYFQYVIENRDKTFGCFKEKYFLRKFDFNRFIFTSLRFNT